MPEAVQGLWGTGGATGTGMVQRLEKPFRVMDFSQIVCGESCGEELRLGSAAWQPWCWSSLRADPC